MTGVWGGYGAGRTAGRRKGGARLLFVGVVALLDHGGRVGAVEDSRATPNPPARGGRGRAPVVAIRSAAGTGGRQRSSSSEHADGVGDGLALDIAAESDRQAGRRTISFACAPNREGSLPCLTASRTADAGGGVTSSASSPSWSVWNRGRRHRLERRGHRAGGPSPSRAIRLRSAARRSRRPPTASAGRWRGAWAARSPIPMSPTRHRSSTTTTHARSGPMSTARVTSGRTSTSTTRIGCILSHSRSGSTAPDGGRAGHDANPISVHMAGAQSDDRRRDHDHRPARGLPDELRHAHRSEHRDAGGEIPVSASPSPTPRRRHRRVRSSPARSSKLSPHVTISSSRSATRTPRARATPTSRRSSL